MKKTPWFKMSTPPTRKGLYECSSCTEKHKWDGRCWDIVGIKDLPSGWYVRNSKWRGLVEEAK